MQHSLNQPALVDAAATASRPLPGAARFCVWWLSAALAVITAWLYWPATHYGFLNYDDSDYVENNPKVLAGLSLSNVVWAFTTGHAQNWHPLTWLSLMLDASVFGPGPRGFHLGNVLLHAMNAVLLFWLLRRLTGAIWMSALAAALFAWHPMHVESVAWVSERKDVLSAFFGFLSLLFYAYYAQGGAEAGNNSAGEGAGQVADVPNPPPHSSFFLLPSSLSYWLSWFCFLLGLLSKPMLVTWPFVLLLLDFWPLRRCGLRSPWALVREKLPFFLLVPVASLVTFLVQQYGGAVMAIHDFPIAMRLANGLFSYCRYLEKLCWPANLAIFYPRDRVTSVSEILLAAGFLAAISWAAYRFRHRQPWLLTGWLWYVGTLVPVIGIVQVGDQAMADRYSYIPSVGVIVIVVWGAQLLVFGPARRGVAAILLIGGISAACVCLFLTRKQLGYWRDSETLFRHAVAVTQDNYLAHESLGNALAGEGKLDEAVVEFQESLRLAPLFTIGHLNLGLTFYRQDNLDGAIGEFRRAVAEEVKNVDAHINLGAALFKNKQTKEAIFEFQEACRLDPKYAMAHDNLALAYAKSDKMDQAHAEFQKAIQLDPKNASFYENFGDALMEQNRTEDATRQWSQAIQLEPENEAIHRKLAIAYSKLGRPAETLREWLAITRASPNDATNHDSLGNALARNNQNAEAVAEFQTAIRLNPQYAKAYDNLGIVLLKLGDTNRAAGQFQEAVRLEPDFAKARDNFGLVLSLQGHTNEAIDQWRESLRLNPNNPRTESNLARFLGPNTWTNLGKADSAANHGAN